MLIRHVRSNVSASGIELCLTRIFRVLLIESCYDSSREAKRSSLCGNGNVLSFVLDSLALARYKHHRSRVHSPRSTGLCWQKGKKRRDKTMRRSLPPSGFSIVIRGSLRCPSQPALWSTAFFKSAGDCLCFLLFIILSVWSVCLDWSFFSFP